MPDRHLDRRLPRRFGTASLFIDNAGYRSGQGCTVWGLPAQGQELSTFRNQALYQLLNAVPSNAPPTFNLPTLTAPASGVEYYMATAGAWPLGSGH